MYFQPAHFPFVPQKGAFYKGQFAIWPRVLIIIKHNYGDKNGLNSVVAFMLTYMKTRH